MDVDSRGRTAEDVPPLSRCALFALQHELVGVKGLPPRVLRLVLAREAVPVGTLFREAPCGKERTRSDCCKPHVLNREVHGDGLLLRILEAVHVLGDAQVVGPPAKHGRQEEDDVSALEAAAAVLEASEEVTEENLVIKGRFFLEGEDPHLLDDGFDECAPGAFNGFDEPLKLDLGVPESLGLGSDSVDRVGGDAVVVRHEGGFHSVEQPPRVFVFVIVVGEEDVGEVNLVAMDVVGLEIVDKGFV